MVLGEARKMRVCKRSVDFVQVIDANGNVRICGWNRNNIIGSLLEDDFHTIYHSDKAVMVRQPILEHLYTDCPVDNCPYLANGTIDEHLIELDEIPPYPKELYLAFEGNCNYKCTCCTSHLNMAQSKEKDWTDNYIRIENGIKDLLPHIKHISANGRGELFASPRILKILSEWKPISPIEELSVSLETNGSLFNEHNWKKIENLGQYNLRVAITVMSFHNDVYQYLSGTSLTIDNLINNLLFVKELREKGIINHFEIATVLQEQNFREMPEFVRKCIKEFEPDSIRIRPIMPGGPLERNIQWFMDVRNPYHPYYSEYKKVMNNPIFQDPRVLLWSGDLDSKRGQLPSVLKTEIIDEQLKIIDKICDSEDINNTIETLMKVNGCNSLAIYGIGRVGKILLRRINHRKIKIPYLIDNYKSGLQYMDKNILSAAEMVHKTNFDKVMVLVTVLYKPEEIKVALLKGNPKMNVILIKDILD